MKTPTTVQLAMQTIAEMSPEEKTRIRLGGEANVTSAGLTEEIALRLDAEEHILYLANHLEYSISDVNETSHGTYEAEGGEYLVLTNLGADKECERQIKDSLWAFNTDFILSHSKADYNAKASIQMAQETLCEDANSLIEALITDLDRFIDDAISSDGRGHFLAGYDFEEIELEGNMYAYRIN